MRYAFILVALLASPASAQDGYDKLKQAFATQQANAPDEYSYKLERTFLAGC